MSSCDIKNFTRVLCALSLLTFVTSVNAEDEVSPVSQSMPLHNVGEPSWSLFLPKEAMVEYRGLVSYDDAGTKSPPMSYPAPNAAGFLAAILTHGVLVESQKQSQKDQLQIEADNVLVPYQSVLNDFKYKDLMQSGLQKISTAGRKELAELTDKPDTNWRIFSSPVFLLTQDQSTIILDNNISIFSPEESEASVYQNTIRVVSEARVAADIVKFWMDNQGEKLKDESASLFARSIEISMSEMTNNADKNNIPQKTYRYFLGQDKKVERGYLVSESCNRMVIKTLRGQLMSVPTTNESSISERCVQ